MKITLDKIANKDNIIIDDILLNKFTNTGNSEVIENEYVDKVLSQEINSIIDNERFDYKPLYDGNQINIIKYNIRLRDVNNNFFLPTTFLSDIGFTNDDIRLNLNRFKKSFLKLDIYDSNFPNNQNLLISYRIPLRIVSDDVINNTVNVNDISLKFFAQSPHITSNINKKSYNIYYFNEQNKELYIRYTFFNASNGVIHNLYNKTLNTINQNDMWHSLYNKITLNGEFYLFFIDPVISNTQQNTNIDYNPTNKELAINLFENKL